MSLKARADRLFAGLVSDIDSEIVVTVDGAAVTRARRGTCANKLIRIRVQLGCLLTNQPTEKSI